MLKEGQSVKKAQVIDRWGMQYDWKTDTFSLVVYWGAYGFQKIVPAASAGAVVEMFEAAERTSAKVYFDGRGGVRKLYFGAVPT